MPYPDDFAGFPPEREPTPAELADEACRDALSEAEQLAALLDRHDGDSGEHADAIESIGGRIAALVVEVRTLLGEPRTMRSGRLVAMEARP